MKNISATDAYKNICENEQCIIVDVREPAETKFSTIKGSILLPLSKLMNEAENIKNKDTLYFICASGGRSSMAADYLESLGHNNSYSIEGGIIEWTNSGLPLE